MAKADNGAAAIGRGGVRHPALVGGQKGGAAKPHAELNGGPGESFQTACEGERADGGERGEERIGADMADASDLVRRTPRSQQKAAGSAAGLDASAWAVWAGIVPLRLRRVSIVPVSH